MVRRAASNMRNGFTCSEVLEKIMQSDPSSELQEILFSLWPQTQESQILIWMWHPHHHLKLPLKAYLGGLGESWEGHGHLLCFCLVCISHHQKAADTEIDLLCFCLLHVVLRAELYIFIFSDASRWVLTLSHSLTHSLTHFKGHLLWKIHFYMVFEHKCVLAVSMWAEPP